MQYRRILVRATNWVGDATMSIPALQALHRAAPQARISILARPWVGELYRRQSFCHELIAYDAPKGWRGLGEKLAIAERLKAGAFDCALLLPNSFEAAAVAWAARIPARIGYERDRRGWLLTRAIRPPLSGEIPRHQRFYYLELLRRAGLIDGYSQDEAIRLEGVQEAAESGRLWLQRAGFTKDFVAIAPGAAYGGAKRWLPERFATATITVARERRLSVAVFGSKQEADICEVVRQQVAAAGVPVANFAGRTTLTELMNCLAAAEVVITNDSGSMHLASALGVRTIAVFGATDEIATGPTGVQSKVVRVPVACSPCLLRECPIDHRCMTAVTAEMVASEALKG